MAIEITALTDRAEETEMDYKSVNFEVKELGKDGMFTGYAAVYDNIDEGGDVILPGAFARALDPTKKKPKLLWQHDPSQPIGVLETLSNDSRGLVVAGRLLTEIQKGNEAHILLKAGAIDSMSIGYRSVEHDFINTAIGTVRQLKSVDLFEVSLVTFPMNPKALVTDVKQLQSPREVEQILRKAGVPGTFAKLVASHGFEEAKNRLISQREAGDDVSPEAEALASILKELKGLKEVFTHV